MPDRVVATDDEILQGFEPTEVEYRTMDVGMAAYLLGMGGGFYRAEIRNGWWWFVIICPEHTIKGWVSNYRNGNARVKPEDYYQRIRTLQREGKRAHAKAVTDSA